jgi:hypothetical protein
VNYKPALAGDCGLGRSAASEGGHGHGGR